MHAVPLIFKETSRIRGCGGLCVHFVRESKVMCIVDVQSGSTKRLPVVLPVAPRHRGEASSSALAYYKLG